jgi:hypothetical protein
MFPHPNIFLADAQQTQAQSVFVPATSNYFYDGYSTNSMTYSPIGSHWYQQGSVTNQAPQRTRGRAVQQLGYPIVDNLSSCQGYFPVMNANSSQDSHQYPILIPTLISSQTTQFHPVSNHRSEASASTPKIISKPLNSRANSTKYSEPAARARCAEEVRVNPFTHRDTEVIDDLSSTLHTLP